MQIRTGLKRFQVKPLKCNQIRCYGNEVNFKSLASVPSSATEKYLKRKEQSQALNIAFTPTTGRASSSIVQDWDRIKSKKEFINEVFQLKLLETDRLEKISKNLKRHFTLTKSTIVLYRKSTHDLITSINGLGQSSASEGISTASSPEEGSSNASLHQGKNSPLILTGLDGVGKSTTLLHLTTHFKSLSDWIVIYFPLPSSWTSGKHEYEHTINGYSQPALARQLITAIIESNQGKLKRPYGVSSNNSETILSHLNSALLSKDLTGAFLTVLDRLSTTSRVLFVIDESNALFGPSAYHSVASVRVQTDEIILVEGVRKIVGRGRGVYVLAKEEAEEDNLDSVDKSVAVNETAMVGDIEGKRISINAFEREEIGRMLEIYGGAGIYSGNGGAEEIERILMVSGGVGTEVLRVAIA